MIDKYSTTFDWQNFTGEVCVFPVGSLEQHSSHLPIDTDNLGVEFFAKIVAEDLDAALLPTLNYGTCLEHSGFRGSISLKPETLMQVVRDIVDEVERQNFKILILMDGHGGNFCLLPVIRDINRLDRDIKILHVKFWEFRGAEAGTEVTPPEYDFHAGERETSIFMAIHPELVKNEFHDVQLKTFEDKIPLRQQDLTTFGIGHFNPAGALGAPSQASIKKGQQAIADIKKNMLPYIRDRIKRLKNFPGYSGKGQN